MFGHLNFAPNLTEGVDCNYIPALTPYMKAAFVIQFTQDAHPTRTEMQPGDPSDHRRIQLLPMLDQNTYLNFCNGC